MKVLLLIIFIMLTSFAIYQSRPSQDQRQLVVVALPFKPNFPLDPHWYTEEYVQYIANQLPKEHYQVKGYFVSLDTMSQFLDEMEKLNAQHGNIVVLNICDGGEWDGYPGLSLCKLWEKHPINGVVRKSGADYQFTLNSDDKIQLQKCLADANLNFLPQVLITLQDSIENDNLIESLSKVGLENRWPLFCKLRIGAGAAGISDISVCHTIEQLRTQIQKLRVDYPNNEVIIQPYLPGPEYTVLVIGDRVYAAVRRDYHNANNIMYDEYLTGMRNVEEEITFLSTPAHVQEFAVKAIQAIPGKKHYTRVDLRDDGHGNIYVIDINDRPGFGTPSTVNCMLEFHHIDEAQFVRDLVETCPL